MCRFWVVHWNENPILSSEIGDFLTLGLGYCGGGSEIKPNANCDVNLIELLFNNYRLEISVFVQFFRVVQLEWHLI